MSGVRTGGARAGPPPDIAWVDPAPADLRMIAPVRWLWYRALSLRWLSSGMDDPVSRFG